jgi:hypothetical protein
MPTITLFKDDCMTGDAQKFSEAIANLKTVGFNDVTSSIVVTEGTWLLFQDQDFNRPIGVVSTTGGAAGTNAYPFPNFWGGRGDRISSLKPV